MAVIQRREEEKREEKRRKEIAKQVPETYFVLLISTEKAVKLVNLCYNLPAKNYRNNFGVQMFVLFCVKLKGAS